MLKIRLTRVGKKNSPSYRVVVADEKRAVKGKFLEIIGNYNPALKPKTLVIDKTRALFWIGRGAQASDTVNNLMCDLGILPKDKKIKKIYAKKKVEEETKKETPVAAAEAPEEDKPAADEATPEIETVAPEAIDPKTEEISEATETPPVEAATEEALATEAKVEEPSEEKK